MEEGGQKRNELMRDRFARLYGGKPHSLEGLGTLETKSVSNYLIQSDIADLEMQIFLKLCSVWPRDLHRIGECIVFENEESVQEFQKAYRLELESVLGGLRSAN